MVRNKQHQKDTHCHLTVRYNWPLFPEITYSREGRVPSHLETTVVQLLMMWWWWQ